MNRKSVIVSILTLAAFAVTAASAQTTSTPGEAKDSQKTPPPASPQAPAKAPVAPQGVVVFKDPVTGEIRQPSASEIGDLQAAEARRVSVQSSSSAQAVRSVPPEGAPIRGLPAGMQGMRLGTDSMVNAVATKTPDGKLVMGEVIGDKAAAAAVTDNAKPDVAKPAKEDGNDR